MYVCNFSFYCTFSFAIVIETFKTVLPEGKSDKKYRMSDDAKSILTEILDWKCPVCFSELAESRMSMIPCFLLGCNTTLHMLCYDCAIKMHRADINFKCPVCKKKATMIIPLRQLVEKTPENLLKLTQAEELMRFSAFAASATGRALSEVVVTLLIGLKFLFWLFAIMFVVSSFVFIALNVITISKTFLLGVVSTGLHIIDVAVVSLWFVSQGISHISTALFCCFFFEFNCIATEIGAMHEKFHMFDRFLIECHK